MSTQQTERGKEEPSSQSPPSIHSQTTLQPEQFTPAQTFLQSPRRPPRPKSRYWIVGVLAALLLVIAMSVGTLLLIPLSQHPGNQATPVPTAPPAVTPTPGSDTTPTPAPGVVLGTQTCPAGIDDPAHWDAIIGTNGGEQNVEGVSCANIMGNPSLQALVTMHHNDVSATLDVYVFNNITGAKPTQLFKLTGLVKGDAKISGYNTVMTAEVDTNSSVNKGQSVSAMTPDLFREFNWSSEEGTLVQTAFPGLFPDLTRYQAEADQARVNQGQDTWKNDPAKVAQALAVKFFGWQRALSTKILSGGGARDVYATVRVQEPPLQGAQSQGPSINVTLSRLEGNTHNFWVAIAVKDDNMLTLTNLEPRQQITSPVTLEGTGSAFEAVIGRAIVFDHLYTDIGHAQVTGTTAGMGKSAYSTKVIYTSSFRAGVQEGMVAVYQANGGISNETYSAVMVKVLLDPEPGVALGPLSCPDAVSNPAYWNPFISMPPNPGVAERVTCGNLLGKPSLQAMVVAHEIVGGGPLFRSVFVFDNITASKPTLLFSVRHMLQGDAQISGYSTIMTAEIDLNSSINKGKPSAQLKVDLFHEFQWSDGAGKFVQVAFPGIYPDLTRYQAEQDQAGINQGQDTWKNDPAKVAKAVAVQFFGWKRALTTKVLSGGGPRDVDATVQVQEAPIQSGPGQSPSVTVTLSRLGGNTHNMWVAIAVNDGSDTLTNIAPRSLIASPVKLEGKGSAFEGVIGMAYILDHLNTTVGRAIVTGTPGIGMGNVPYSILVSYDTSFKTGPQEGIVEIQLTSPVEADPYSVVMVKVLLDPQPQVSLGLVSCPVAVQQAGFWQTLLGIDSNKGGVGTVSCANLKGDPSLQALVPVFHNDGTSGSTYVYDHLTDAHPVQIFKLQAASAMISGYSTLMTSEVDQNSSINRGKNADQMTADLFREFQWSKSAGTFVQVAFPGLYPDLTRWQAEQDQSLINAGQATWKNDPAQVARHMATDLFKWSDKAQTTVLSGGGPKDVDAVVQVRSTGPDHPVIKVTLSRLEGNTHNIWEVIAVVDGSTMSITSPQKWDRLSSPATVKGTGSAFEGDVGTVFVLDHLYNDIGHAKGVPANNGKTTFTATVPYNATFHGGTQEGVLAFYTYSQADGAIAGVVMLKVLIGA